MSVLSDIRDGIKTVLGSTSLRVYEYPPNPGHPDEEVTRPYLEYPCAVIEAEEPDGQYLTFGGNTFEVLHTLTVYIKSSSPIDAWREMDDYRSPTGDKSIRAALRADRTLDGNADDADVEWAASAEAGRSNPDWRWEYSCQLGIRVIKSVS